MQKSKLSKNSTSLRRFFQWNPWHYLVIAGCVIVAFLFLRGNYGHIQYKQLQKQRRELVQQISDLKKQQGELAQEIDNLMNNYRYIEKIVREKYKMGKNGEKIYFMISPSEKDKYN
jgi:cell division protein FtsB